MKSKTYSDYVSTMMIAGVAPMSEAEWTAQHKPQPVPQMVKCDCGHISAHPMMANNGTTCSDCYDRMS